MSIGCKAACGARSAAVSPGLRAAASALVLGALLVPAHALAAEGALTFSIPAQRLEDALVSFGVQAGVSVGAQDLSRCGRTASAVVGRFTRTAALERLLAGTRCGSTVVDARAFRVAPRPPAARRSAPPAPLAAAPQRSEPSEVLLDLTVTATRRPSLVSRTPASVSVAASPTLTAGRLETLHDVVPEFAGVTVTNLGPGRNKVFVRGLSDGAFTGRTQSTVGIYLDDLPITYNAPDPDLRLVDVERVELMRGPQGSLYGVGSMGGVVRVVTRQPDLTRYEAGAAVSGARTRFGEPSYAGEAMINAPVLHGRLAVRGVAYSERLGGYVDDFALGVPDANQTRRKGGRVAITGVVSPSWRLTIGGALQSIRTDDSQYASGGADGLSRDNFVREPHDNDFTQAFATLDGSGGWGRLRVSAASVRHDFFTRYDASRGVRLFGANTNQGTFDQTNRVRLSVAEAVWTSPPATRLQWLAGVFASHTTDELHLDVSGVEGRRRIPLYLEDRRDRLGDVAVYGELGVPITRSLSLTAGARAFHAWTRTTSARDFLDGNATRSFEGRLNTDGVSPKVVLSWQAAPSKLLYVQAAQGYRGSGFNTTGRINQQFNASATGNQPNRRYRPDKLWSFEAGAKASFMERRLDVRSALAYTDWRDVQSDQFLPSGLPYTANVGRAVNIGFETETAFQVDRSLNLRLSFLVNEPQLKQRDTTYPARPNASLPAVPRYSATLVADWRRMVAPGLVAILYGRVAYVGASVLTFQEQASSQMGNYITARAAVGLEYRRWRATAFIDNPANAEGDTFAFGDPFTQGRVGQSTPLRPRTFGLTLATGL